MKTWPLVAAVAVGLALGSLATLPFRDRQATAPNDASEQTSMTAVGPSPSGTARTSAAAPPTSTDPTGSPSPSSGATQPVSGIQTSSLFYFGAPLETIHIPGTYHGVNAATELRLQLRRPEGWTAFPLPVVTHPSGEFRAYVELGAGRYRLRVMDPRTGERSANITLLVF